MTPRVFRRVSPAPFQVPSEVFRLGRTRVFFRAGQISTLQKILNETGPEKGPWIFGRLQEALANRHKAKAAAEQAQVPCLSPLFVVVCSPLSGGRCVRCPRSA